MTLSTLLLYPRMQVLDVGVLKRDGFDDGMYDVGWKMWYSFLYRLWRC
jgi:hypothetical protein